MAKLPGIFNDVIGPVMRGPSSSHTAASWRIARTCLDILNQPLKNAIIEFDKDGIWASNYEEQGTVMGINSGLLGLDITDNRMKNTEQVAVDKEITIIYEINSYPTKHTNTVRLSLEGIDGNKVQFLAVSLGGGSFEIQQIDGFDVTINGDYYELLLLDKKNNVKFDELKKYFSQNVLITQSLKSGDSLINFKSSNIFSDEVLNQLKENFDFDRLVLVNPVMPIISGNESELPFTSIISLLNYAEKESFDLGKLGLMYEKCQSGLSESELHSRMKIIIDTIENSIAIGLQGTKYDDRILHQQSHLVEKAEQNKKILKNTIVNNIVSYITAIMESKSAMEVIVANPTAGSCGTVGGVLRAVADDLNSTSDEIVKAYFAAGIVGAYFADGPGFSAEEHGCQVECGAASGMAAAGIVQLLGGTTKQAIDAASMAIQNMIGLVCDPVADRVEVPCLGKNISAAMNALSSATMACSGFDAVIPLDQVIETVEIVSENMPSCVKCTGKGGLAVTPAALDLKKR
jgi:L-serine dehydratase